MDRSWYQAGSGEGLKMRAQFSEQTAIAERCSATRGFQLADRFPYTWQCKPYAAKGIITIMQNGKTNQVCAALNLVRVCSACSTALMSNELEPQTCVREGSVQLQMQLPAHATASRHQCRLRFQYRAQRAVTCVAMFLSTQNGQVLYTGVVRHKDPRRCPIAADGLWQVFRFTFGGQEFPDFNGDPEPW
jgi:hypothetical protein